MSQNRQPEAAAKRARALELRLAGRTYVQIAETVGYSSKGGAFRAVREALDAVDPDGGEAHGLTELARLDAMLTGLWPKARRGDPAAVDRVLRIEERRDELRARQLEQDPPAEQETGLSDFERRLADRDAATAARRATGG